MVIYFQGTSTIVLIVNMRQLVLPEQASKNDQYSYSLDLIRCKEEFAKVLRKDWPAQLAASEVFHKHDYQEEQLTAPERIGFATGLFRQSFLDTYGTPMYRVNWQNLLREIGQQQDVDKHSFAGFDQSHDFQTLAAPRFQEWQAFVRPTTTGMIVIKFVRRYTSLKAGDKPASVLKVVKNIVDMQACFDLERLTVSPNPNDQALLHLLEHNQKEFFLRLAPLQWQLASMICRQFIKEVTAATQNAVIVEVIRHRIRPVNQTEKNGKRDESKDKTDDSENDEKVNVPLNFILNQRIYPPIHDSFVIHHIDGLREKAKLNEIDPTHEEIKRNDELVRALYMLAEGSILVPREENIEDLPLKHNVEHAQKLVHDSQTTMDDELCLLTSRTAIIWPSDKVPKDYELYIGQMPLSDSLTYRDYWRAVERMIEFIVEIRVLVQIADRVSTDIVRDFVQELNRTREGMKRSNIILNIDHLHALAANSANLSRLVGVCQSLATPHRWSRAEFAMIKANYLIQQMQIHDLLENTKFNLTTLTNLVNHYDDLYLADLAETSQETAEERNRRTAQIANTLALFSIVLVVYTLPSFMFDLFGIGKDQIDPTSVTPPLAYEVMGVVGFLGAIAIIIFVIALFGMNTKKQPAKEDGSPSDQSLLQVKKPE